jgi:chitinase
LNDTCAPADSQSGSAVSAVAAWRAAGIPANQLVLAVAAYGHSWTVTPDNAFVNGKSGKLAVFAPADTAKPPTGDSWDDAAGVDQCGNAAGPGGLWDFWGLVKNGWLTKKGVAAQGVDYLFDTCSQTVCAALPVTEEILIQSQ